MTDRDLYSGLIRLHILHHAAAEPIFGLGIISELGRHGYSLSAGTVYPVLHWLERKRYLKASRQEVGDKGAPRVSRHRAGPQGVGGSEGEGAGTIRRTVRGVRRTT